MAVALIRVICANCEHEAQMSPSSCDLIVEEFVPVLLWFCAGCGDGKWPLRHPAMRALVLASGVSAWGTRATQPERSTWLRRQRPSI